MFLKYIHTASHVPDRGVAPIVSIYDGIGNLRSLEGCTIGDEMGILVADCNGMVTEEGDPMILPSLFISHSIIEFFHLYVNIQ